jgi:hypothetical protein
MFGRERRRIKVFCFRRAGLRLFFRKRSSFFSHSQLALVQGATSRGRRKVRVRVTNVFVRPENPGLPETILPGHR